MMDFLTQPFAFAFMQKAFLISIALGIPMALLSCFLVLKGWSLMGDAVSHAVLPGVVLAYVFGLPLAIGAFVAGMACALGTGFLHANSRLKQDTVMGVVFSGMFALGIVMYVAIQPEVHLDHILFGDILGLSWPDVVETAVIALICSVGLLVWRKDLGLHAFDPQHAQAIGLPVKWLHYGFLAVISLTVVAALKAAGLILAIALLIAPGSIAFLATRRLGRMLLAAVCVTILAAIVGVFASFHIDSAPAPTIVLILTGIFLCVFAWQQWRARRLADSIERNDRTSSLLR